MHSSFLALDRRNIKFLESPNFLPVLKLQVKRSTWYYNDNYYHYDDIIP